MSLRFTLLGFVSTAPASGYDISKEFDESMAWFWNASHSQIYPELRRLEADGLIESQSTASGGSGGQRLQKRLYRITSEGEEALAKWVEAPVSYPPVRDPERIKLIYLDKAPREVIRRHLEEHKRHHEAELALWNGGHQAILDGTSPRLIKRLAGRPAQDHGLISGLKSLAFEGNAERARHEIRWAEDAIRWLDELEEEDQG
jgi:DNA-binding PadR family transcriptional regulator